MSSKSKIASAVLCVAMLCGCSAGRKRAADKVIDDAVTLARTASQTEKIEFGTPVKVGESGDGGLVEQFTVKNKGKKTLSFLGTLSGKISGSDASDQQLVSDEKHFALWQSSDDVKSGSIALHTPYWTGEGAGTPFAVTRLKPGEKRTYQLTMKPTDERNLPARDRAIADLHFTTRDPYTAERMLNQSDADYSEREKQTIGTLKAFTNEDKRVRATMDSNMEGVLENKTGRKIKKAFVYFSFASSSAAHPEAFMLKNIGAGKKVRYRGNLSSVLNRDDFSVGVIGNGVNGTVDDEEGAFAGSLGKIVYYI